MGQLYVKYPLPAMSSTGGGFFNAVTYDAVPAGLATAGLGVIHDVVRDQEEGLELSWIRKKKNETRHVVEYFQRGQDTANSLDVSGSRWTYPFNAPSQKVGLEDLLLRQGLAALEDAEGLGNSQTTVHLAYQS